MINKLLVSFTINALLLPYLVSAQDGPVYPSVVRTGTYWGLSKPLREIAPMTAEEFKIMEAKSHEKRELNEGLRTRSYPFEATALPKGPDPVWQNFMGNVAASRAPITNFDGQVSPYYPPDCNGAVGPDHYMQTINCVYAIYSKTGTLIAGPTNMNQLFSGVTGANCNDGDPVVLYDEIADRWLATEFSLCGSTDRMLMAVSQTNDPTGAWHRYSFDVDDMPDYPKFGVWRDGYYMGVNNSGSKDIYVFERNAMLTGATAQMVGFDNAWRPNTIDGFSCVPPVDNDGALAPEGTPGLFIAMNDDAIGGGSDQLWIYELNVNWATPSSSTFQRTQQIDVAAFDSNFGNNWNNISQQGTSQRLDAIPQVIMNPPKYRNFGSYQTIVCCHTVDVDATNHAGVRWYELRKTSGNWTVRQQGTFAPDNHSRWMGSIAMNGAGEIGLGYSVSSPTLFPSIRYTGQSAAANAMASGVLDIPEDIIYAGLYSQTGANRWGDYSAMSVDPVNDETFWYTNQYVGGGDSRRTRIASFEIGVMAPYANFNASETLPCLNTTVVFTDMSIGDPTSWQWSFQPDNVIYVDSTTSTSQSPHVQFTQYGTYTVTLTATNAGGSNTNTKANLIQVNTVNGDFSASATTVVIGSSTTFTDGSTCEVNSWNWNFGDGANPPAATTQGPHVVSYSTPGFKTITLTINDTLIVTKPDYINVIDSVFNMYNASVSTCSGYFYDPGGPSANYPNNTDLVMTLFPGSPGNAVKVEFLSFALESNIFCSKDYLKVFNGAGTSSPLMGTFCGTTIPGPFTANNPEGALTLVFHSNASINLSGWEAHISCEAVLPALSITPSEITVSDTAGVVYFDIVSNSNWIASSNVSWCSVTSSGSGSGTLTATYEENNDHVVRTADISITVNGIPPQVVQLIQLPSFVSAGRTGAESIRLFPNPNNGKFYISSPTSQPIDLEIVITDLAGRVMISRKCQNESGYFFDLSGYRKGNYFAKATSGNITYQWKLIIQ